MQKTILITGATDGIGLETARMLASQGHRLLLHGRSREKLAQVSQVLSGMPDTGDAGTDQIETCQIETYIADLSVMADVEAFARAVAERHTSIDVLINNAGVYAAPEPTTRDGLDVRFAVNTIAPYLLTRRLLSLLGSSGRVINLSSAAQAPVDTGALAGPAILSDNAAYAQSKLALTIWSRSMGLSLKDGGPAVIAVNPASMLGSKMVKQAFGVAGGDLGVGADILCRAALSDEFAAATGKYFDNDSGRFSLPHPDALDPQKCEAVVAAIKAVLANTTT